MKVVFQYLTLKGEAYLELQPEHGADQKVLRNIFREGYARGYGLEPDGSGKERYTHMYVSAMKNPAS